MKKIISLVVTVLTLIVILAPKADAQVLYCDRCCDGNGYVRCGGLWMPCGYQCTCAGIPGLGNAC